MNDAESPRNDAMDGPGRQPHPDDQAYPGPAPDPYGAYPQEGYGHDPYAPADPYAQQAYGYDPYETQAQTGYADPYTPAEPAHQDGPYGTDPGARPRIPHQYRPGEYPGYDGQEYGGQDHGGQGWDQQGQDQAYGAQGYDSQGYDTQGYDTQGYGAQGYGAQGYDGQGYDGYGGAYADPVAAPGPGDPYAEPYAEPAAPPRPEPDEDASPPAGGAPADPSASAPKAEYRTEQFAFVDDAEEDEEVIDWLKFAETRSERRDERRRQGRLRIVALALAAVLVLAGGVGWLWWQGKGPFAGSGGSAATAAGQKRDVIAVHLMDPDSAESSTALLVNNESTGRGTTVLLPNALAVSTDDAGSTTLGQSVDEEGMGPTRDAVSTLLGAEIKGSWRLDTPFLELLVESVGGITVSTDVEVRGTGEDKDRTLVAKGPDQELRGPAAVAYATHRASGESADKQLARFGQVLQAVLKKAPGDPASATRLVEGLGMVADPSLPEKELGASLAPLAKQAQAGKYRTVELTAKADGTVDKAAAADLVEDVLGGTVKNADPQATPRVRVDDATGDPDALQDAQVALVNGGYTFASGGKADEPAATSRVEYVEDVRAATAKEVARTLGLPESAVKKVKGEPGNLDITVVLGQDFGD
ncbi:hypothetical protein GCM10027168_68730 [Streptomyces capparidis]